MRSFEEIPDIAERIKRSKMELQESGFYWAPEWDSQSCCDQDYVNNFKKGWESRQTEVDEITQLYAKELFNKKVLAKKASEKLAGLQLQNDELQKRVDDLTQVMEELLEEMKYPTATFEEVICCGIKELEQVIKGGFDASN